MAQNRLNARLVTASFVLLAIVTGGAARVSATPPPAAASYSVTQVTTGDINTCALTANGTVACWGGNSYGELGNGTATDSHSPVLVTGGALADKTVTQISTGKFHTCAVTSDGIVACWGGNNFGELGIGNNTNSNVPVAVSGGALTGKTVVNVTAGGEHTCALTTDSTVACWGTNFYGELGIGNTTNSNVPQALATDAFGGDTVMKISAGAYHTCAVTSSGDLYCWGDNSYGELGDGTNSLSNVPTSITGGPLSSHAAVSVSTGNSHTCALLLNGSLACWGQDFYGQLGDGTNTDSKSPVAVTGGAVSNNVVTGVSAGAFQTCATLKSGTVACWGFNLAGQLGNGTQNDASTPTAATGGALTGVTAKSVSTGAFHSCAVLVNGTVSCWGSNAYGKLGDGTTTTSFTAVTVLWPVPAAATSMPRISGTTRTGQTLTLTNGDWTGTPAPSFSYQWYACTTQVLSATQTIPGTCLAVSNATNNSLALTSSQGGKYMAVAVTGTSGSTARSTWLTPTTGKVAMKAAASVKPTISGAAKVNKTLTAGKGTWAGSPTPTFKYKWYACTNKVASATQTIPRTCRAIGGATKSSLKLVAAHKGSFIAVAVTATSAGTTSTVWLSKSTGSKVS